MNLLSTLIYSHNNGIRLARHVLFWVANGVSYLAIISSTTEVDWVVVFGLLTRLMMVAGVVYLIIYYLIPKYTRHRDIPNLLFWLLAIVLFIGLGMPYFRYYVINVLFWPECPVPSNPFFFGSILGEVFNWMAVIGSAIAIKVIKSKNELQQKAAALWNEKKIAELSFLKAQMHPHFLFNTLNTLYSEAIKTSDTKSEHIVLKLSNLMRFILEECNKPLIPLTKEIQVISDYIALEKIRHGSRLQVDFRHGVSDASDSISPLLLLPFVENSFKHTLSAQRGVVPISIHVHSDDNNILLHVENDVIPQESRVMKSHGLGIGNIRKQLELLFGESYSLDIAINRKYVVNLKIPKVKHE